MNAEQIIGLTTGVIFGFLLQKGRVLRFEKQIGAMLLKDMTILKFMLSSILIGMVGLLFLSDFEIIKFSHKPMNVGAVVIGGSLFGIGWSIMGFCPGTSIGALGEGRWHAIFAIIGMIIGAALFAELFPFFESTVNAWKDFGKIGIPETIGINHWIIVLILWVAVISIFVLFEKKKL